MTSFNNSLFMQSAQGFAPLTSGSNFTPVTGFEGVPFMSENPLLGMLAQPFLTNFMGARGLTPMGFSDQNVYDTLQKQRLTQMQSESITAAAQRDRLMVMRTMRGVARMTGTPWGPDQLSAAGAMANSFAAMAPMATMMFPDLMDEMGGFRGSQAVMTAHMFDAGRYRMDPVTGRQGMSTDSTKSQSAALYQSLFESGRPQDMLGLSAGQAGQLYRAMTLRGMMPGTDPREGLTSAIEQMQRTGPRNRAELNSIAQNVGVDLPDDLNKLTGQQVDKLLGDDRMQARVRSFDTEKVKRSIQSYAGAVAAMRDIFGDQGRTNVPMIELLNSLDQLSGGMMSQISPAKLQNMVRTTRNLANSAGISMDAAMLMQTQGSQTAANMGIESIFGVQAAQGGMAFAAAFNQIGFNEVPVWGRGGLNEQTQADINLRAAAAASPAANRVGAALRVAEAAVTTNEKGLVQDRGIKALGDGDFKRYVQALQQASTTGQTEWQDSTGKMRSLNLREDQISELVTSATLANGQSLGVSSAQFQQMVGQQHLNRRPVMEFNIQDMLRDRQFQDDIKPQLSTVAGYTIAGRLKDAGMVSATADALGGSISDTLVEDLRRMDQRDLADNNKIMDGIAGSVQKQLMATEEGRKMLNDKFGGDLTSGEAQSYFRGLAQTLYGEMDTQAQLGLNSTLQNVLVQHSPEMASRVFRNRADAQTKSDIQNMTTQVRRSSPFRNLMDYIQNDKSPDFEKAVGKFFGGVENSDLKKGLTTGIQSWKERSDKLEEVRQAYLSAAETASKDPGNEAARKAAEEKYKEFEDSKREFKSSSDALAGMADNMGMLMDDNFNAGTVADAVAMSEAAATATGDVADKILTTAPGDRDKAYKKFMRTDSGKAYSEYTREAVARSELVAFQAVKGDKALLHVGEKGIKQAEKIRNANQKLSELSSIYTDRDLARLLAGGFNAGDETKTAKIMDEARALVAERDEGLKTLQTLAEGTSTSDTERMTEIRKQLAQIDGQPETEESKAERAKLQQEFDTEEKKQLEGLTGKAADVRKAIDASPDDVAKALAAAYDLPSDKLESLATKLGSSDATRQMGVSLTKAQTRLSELGREALGAEAVKGMSDDEIADQLRKKQAAGLVKLDGDKTREMEHLFALQKSFGLDVVGAEGKGPFSGQAATDRITESLGRVVEADSELAQRGLIPSSGGAGGDSKFPSKINVHLTSGRLDVETGEFEADGYATGVEHEASA